MKTGVLQFAAVGSSARGLALQVLLECRQHDAFVQEILERRLGSTELGPADRRLTTGLVYGVLRRRATLDALLRPLIQRQMAKVEPWLWDALRLGAFQLALLTQIPPHAALHETVELAASLGRPGAKGFLNGVLRSLTRLLGDEHTTAPAADALPIMNGQYRRLTRAVLPAPAAHPVEYLATAFALPAWLVERWLTRFGWDECLRLGFWFASPTPLWLRSNRLRIDRTALLHALAEAGIGAEAGDHPQAVRLLDSVSIRELPGYEQGWFTVQDESAMRVGSALAPEPGSQVLDACAAPGGKTTHLAELMRNQGRIIACDVDDRRLATVMELCRRLGVTIVEPCRIHAERDEEPPAGPFDSILVDAPCSNSGVLGRRPEARWRIQPRDMHELVVLQKKLLLQAAERLRPGGRVVYSTCSIEPEENSGVVRAVLGAFPDLELDAEQEQVPGRPADGGYWARLHKRECSKRWA
ncbi:MAG TPA: 16S rRNA (cytosine(967)-C(5))-methyltransferase RsmB [Gemmataceae bacterium]|nr:16S rRNA (cytosine(967)-C(5))-methyltransferase RsmB [Gemmataceae bacterium]